LRGVPVFVPDFTGTHCVYPRRNGQAELSWVNSHPSKYQKGSALINFVDATNGVTNSAKPQPPGIKHGSKHNSASK